MRWLKRVVGINLLALLFTGCVMHSTTPEWEAGHPTATIYRVSEREAFVTVLEALADELPSQSVDDDWKGSQRGYGATSKFGLDWTEYHILILPVTGTDAQGQTVHGYRYELHSSGSRLIENPMRHTRLREYIHGKLAQTAVTITDPRMGSYETDGKAYLGQKRDAKDVLRLIAQ
jgi:hypothetical protein